MSLRTIVATTVAVAALTAGCGKPTENAAQASPAGTPGPALQGRRIDVTASNDGYTPSTIVAKQGEDLVLRFTRTTKSECLAEVVFPELKIKKELPLNTPVEIAVKADKAGKIPFQCGMAMVHGSIDVSGG